MGLPLVEPFCDGVELAVNIGELVGDVVKLCRESAVWIGSCVSDRVGCVSEHGVSTRAATPTKCSHAGTMPKASSHMLQIRHCIFGVPVRRIASNRPSFERLPWNRIFFVYLVILTVGVQPLSKVGDLILGDAAIGGIEAYLFAAVALEANPNWHSRV